MLSLFFISISVFAKFSAATLVSPYSEPYENTRGELWEITDKISDLPFPVGKHSSTLTTTNLGSFIYIIGGCASELKYTGILEDEEANVGMEMSKWSCSDISKKVITYDPESFKYEELPDLPVGRYGHTAVEVNGFIWVLGGKEKHTLVDVTFEKIAEDVYVFDVNSQKWSKKGAFSEATSEGAAWTFGDDAFYYAGGYNANWEAVGYTYKFETSRPGDNEASYSFYKVASLNEARGGISAAVIGQSAYVAGGSSDENYCEHLQSVERYNNGYWKKMDHLKRGAGSKATTVLNGQLLSFGGAHTSDCTPDLMTISEVEAYDLSRQIIGEGWYTHGVVPENRFFYTATSWPRPNSVFIMGGFQFYEDDCQCIRATKKTSVYILQEQKDLILQKTGPGRKTGVIITFIVLTTGVVALAANDIRQKRTRRENLESTTATVVNQEAVSDLPGAVGQVEDNLKNNDIV
mmetsp:Transcript_33607/g.77532  ORF Transcript_33607/g.77532 Transcript_33607/m.77532 type:complete len:463 (-) Transcript_33607:629-2017(-)|eukprot:CAMPEP_0113312606 /NCGR_PEP_ID=MMETSP0010_2-20120614/9375_1 /TAXON_ID=216773 ORGANISM="Corethron hystrix, Strain 308" /NCGR_SAMPLE_ID=MMETSP0010_2 /ASSEMBLY_ACC=CAM_ASM_000155 /LENGTH=462 /DNA_ID=CAMNT_0000168477 /DNA_START=168 /DNA_END=1556 /DNA_ORIENTATION=+ /assembly_acc=CAM_ASM_000155